LGLSFEEEEGKWAINKRRDGKEMKE